MKTPEEIDLLVLAWQETRDESAFEEIYKATRPIVGKARIFNPD
jgi:hypothetical protein